MDISLKLTRDANIKHYGKSEIIIDIEEYLKGVVGSEIGNASINACRAQAVAARTFAFIKASKEQQITDTSSKDQAYIVSRNSSSYANAVQAVEDTKGQVLYYNGKLITTCSYSNSNGGRIKSSKEVWGGERAWLQAKDDPYDKGPGNGHGVGMSQWGAKEMAKQGFDYKQILSFYYPGTEIKEGYGMSNENFDKVKNWCLSKKNCGYVYGATGQTLTQSVLSVLKSRHPDEVNEDLCWRLWAGKQVYDCAGFVSEAMKQIGFSITAGATSAWDKGKWYAKGTIDSLPKDKVCCLYRQSTKNPSKKQHTGIYFGDGTFMDSRGTKSGVMGPNDMSTYPWTHWAIPPQLADSSVAPQQEPEVIKVAYQAKVTATSGGSVNMRQSPSSSAKVIARVALGQTVDVTSVTGDWSAITWDGKSGYMMSKYLQKVEGSEDNKVWYVRIECDSEAQAKAIAKILASAQATA